MMNQKSHGLSLLMLCVCALFSGPLFNLSAQAGEDFGGLSPLRMTLSGTVQYSDTDPEMPEEMFGTWQRTRTMLESTFPGQFEAFETGYWTLSKSDDNVLTISNPETGAKSRVHVESVQGQTVKFEYLSQGPHGTQCHEELILSATDDAIAGTQQRVCGFGKVAQYRAVARVSGYRLDQGPAISIFR
jgi:hypothetical protein